MIKISVMWMTRKRSHELIYSLSSFIHNADDNANVEYIFVTDPDDEETSIALEKIVPMADAYSAELIHIAADKRYGYSELEQYQNLAAKNFTGDCILSYADDNICIEKGWDTEIRKGLEERKGKPVFIAITPINEIWKGSSTVVGINREWYETTNRFSGNRATDAYLCDLAAAANIKQFRPDVKILHLQRGRETAGEIIQNGVKRAVWGLPGEDDFGGYNAKNPIPPKYYHNPDEFQEPKTDFVEGKRRFDDDLIKLKEYYEKILTNN